ncbi:MAG: MFS transporter [Caldilineales bacterium]|nr:MFS transporter [Caldilineales bacterium]
MIKNFRVVTYSCYLSMLFLGISGALIGAAAKSIGLSPYQIGIMIAAQNLGFIVSVMITGALADTHSKPKILAIGSLILGIAFLVFYSIGTFWLNLIIMFAIGAGIGAYEGVTDALLLDIHDERQNYYINVNHFFVTLGSIIIAVYLTFLSLNWRNAVIQSGVIVLVLAVIFIFMRVRRRDIEHAPYLDRLRILTRDRVVIVLFLATFLAVGVEAGTVGILTSFLTELRDFTSFSAQFALIVFLIGMAIGRLLVGYFSGVDQIANTLLILFGASVFIYGALYFLSVGQASYVFILLAGLSMSAIVPLLLTLAGVLYPAMSGTVLGAVKVALPLGGIVLPFLMSMITRQASFQAALAIFPLAFLLGFVVLFLSVRDVSIPVVKEAV